MHLPTQLDVSVSTTPGALSALEALCDYAPYKSTFTLHYIISTTRTVIFTSEAVDIPARKPAQTWRPRSRRREKRRSDENETSSPTAATTSEPETQS